MKNSNFIAFGLAVILYLAQLSECANKCYACNGLTCDNQEQTCRNSLSFCQKVVTSTAGVNVIVKSCADNCVNGYQQTFGPSTITYSCCTNDNCNGALSQFMGNKLVASILTLIASSYLWLKR